jgi:hypothetical protein
MELEGFELYHRVQFTAIAETTAFWPVLAILLAGASSVERTSLFDFIRGRERQADSGANRHSLRQTARGDHWVGEYSGTIGFQQWIAVEKRTRGPSSPSRMQRLAPGWCAYMLDDGGGRPKHDGGILPVTQVNFRADPGFSPMDVPPPAGSL